MALNSFQHMEETVEAIQLTPETSSEIAKLLGKEIATGVLATCNIVFNKTTECYGFNWRYKTATVEEKLAQNDYLVQLNDGRLTAMAKDKFLELYSDETNDPVIDPALTKTIKGAIVKFIQDNYSDIPVTEEADLNNETIAALMEKLSSWYNAESNVFVLKFNDKGLTSFEGLADVLNMFITKASYMNDSTKFILNFNNGVEEGTPNLFKTIALQMFPREIKAFELGRRKKLIGINFNAVSSDAFSAIAPSVSAETWKNFCIDAMNATGVLSSNAIKK